MDSRERLYTALNHEKPDRAPTDFWAFRGSWRIIEQSSGMTPEQFLDFHDIDLRYIEGPRYTGPPLEENSDIWGVLRKWATVSTPYGYEEYSEVDTSPLKSMISAEEISAYTRWPDADDYDYSVVREQATTIREKGRISVFMGDRLNRIAQLKPAMYLRGVEQILLDLAVDPEIAGAVIRRISSFYKEYLARLLEAADGSLDIVLTGDDFGGQRGLLVGPAMWEEYLASGFEEYMTIIHNFGAKSMHHTCGDVRDIAFRLHELGLDILQSMQPEAMADAYAALKRYPGDTLSFHGGISIQQTMPYGNKDAIAAEVRERMCTLGSGGGYILGTAHNIQADCPYENVVALLEAYSAWGRY